MTADLDTSAPEQSEAAWASNWSSTPRVFRLSFSGPGLATAAFFFAISLQPSLLPRAGYVQGVVSGVTLMIGYGIGSAGQSLWDYLQIPKPTGRARTIVIAVVSAFLAWAVLSSVWRQVGWQNETRELFGMAPASPTAWPIIVGVSALVAALILIVARSLRRLFGFAGTWLGRHLPPRLAVVLGSVALLVLIWGLVTGVLVNGFFTVANVMFSGRDTATTPGIEQPQAAQRSGSPGSQVAWDQLGRQGRSFVATGPTVEQINAFSGGDAQTPIRAYVGLKSADTVQARADLLLAELQRTGAFDREALVIATTTGTGFLDPNGVDPVEYIFNGDIAIAGVQYSYLPSWISLLADQDNVKQTSRVVFDRVHDYWSTLPEDSRPQLYLYGLSLGSFGVESVLSSINTLNEPIDGAFMSGPPFVNGLHDQLEASRQPGTAPWLPVVDDGRTVRFLSEQGGSELVEGSWGPTRLVYLQHGSDPVVFFSPSLALTPPDWLLDGQRSPDVSPEMGWFPLVTLWQVALDLPGAGNVPYGFGHMYSKAANLQGWVDVTNPPDWTPAKSAALLEALEAQPAVGE